MGSTSRVELPFGVASESLRDLVGQIGPDLPRAVLGDEAEALGAVVPALSRGARVEPDRGRIISATIDLVEALGSERLVCWLVEDLHWADSPRLGSLWLPGPCGAVGFGAPPGDGTDGSRQSCRSRGGRCSRAPGADAVVLARLDPDQTRQQLSGLPVTLEPDTTSQIVELSGGVPFLVEEMVASRGEDGRLGTETLRRLGLSRLPRLSTQARGAGGPGSGGCRSPLSASAGGRTGGCAGDDTRGGGRRHPGRGLGPWGAQIQPCADQRGRRGCAFAGGAAPPPPDVGGGHRA